MKRGGFFLMRESTTPRDTVTQLTQENWIKLVERHGFSLVKLFHPNPAGVEDGYVFQKVE